MDGVPPFVFLCSLETRHFCAHNYMFILYVHVHVKVTCKYMFYHELYTHKRQAGPDLSGFRYTYTRETQ